MTKILTSAYITLSKVYDGADGFTISLSMPNMNILCDSDGIPFPGEIGRNGKAQCTVKVFGTRQLTVTSSSSTGPGQYSYSIDHSNTINCEPVILSPDTFYIESIGAQPTAKVCIIVDIEGKNKVKQEINITKMLASDVNFGVDGKFIYGTAMWSSNQISYVQPSSSVKVVKSSEAQYGNSVIEAVGENWFYSAKAVPLDDKKIYRLTFRVRQTRDPMSGDKIGYLGVTPFDSSNSPIGIDGSNNTYFWYGSLSNSWTIHTYYFAKSSRAAINDIHGVQQYPAVIGLPAGTVKFKPMFIVNYVNSNGIVEVDSCYLEDVTAEFEVAEMKNKTVKLETDMNGINASVSTIKTITDKSDNPMTLKCKVNYNTYRDRHEGDLYVYGLNENKSPGDVDGICRWLNADVTLPKGSFNPEKQIPPKIPVFMMFDRNLREWNMVWDEINDEGHSNLKYMRNTWSSSRQPLNYSPDESNHIYVGYFVISEKKQDNGDDILVMGQIFTGALTYSQATSMSLSSGLSQIEIIEDNINMKVDRDGVVAAINIYTQVDNSGTNTSGVKIRGDKIDLEGQVKFSSLSDDNTEGLKKLFKNEGNTTLIDGGHISTKTIKADSIDLLSGLTVLGKDNVPVFAISRIDGTTDRGTVEVNGLLKSGNFSETNNTGYKISPDGTAILNQAKIRGDVILPNAGMTNYGGDRVDTTNYTRIWAGSSYEARDTAPFRVMQNGDVYAKNGTYEGLLRGTLDSGDVQIFNNAITINSPGTENEIIGLRAQQSYFNTDFALGNNNLIFSKSQRLFTFYSSTISFKHEITSTAGASFEFNSSGNEITSFRIINPINGTNTNLSIGYNNSYSNTSLFIHSGNKGTNSDIEFMRQDPNENIDFKINGNIIMKNSIKGVNNSIEIRNMGEEGWGFFAH